MPVSDAALATGASLSPTALSLLMRLAGEPDPVGARIAARLLLEEGHQLSEASVSRVLLQLDELGLTEAVGRKGRRLTVEGRNLVQRQASDRSRNVDFGKALDIRTTQQLMDWLRARRGVESEAARLAADRAEDEEIERLDALIHGDSDHQASAADRSATAVSFHAELARAAHSDVITALTNSLHTPDLVPLEGLLVAVTGHNAKGVEWTEHRAIIEAIRRRDPEAAAQAMTDHLSRLIREADEVATGGLAEVLPHLLSWARQQG